jgi:hypothetical protein
MSRINGSALHDGELPNGRLLVTVTLNPNQLRAHLEPITDLDAVERVTLVADVAGPPMAKLRTIVPPPLVTRVLGRAGASSSSRCWSRCASARPGCSATTSCRTG